MVKAILLVSEVGYPNLKIMYKMNWVTLDHGKIVFISKLTFMT